MKRARKPLGLPFRGLLSVVFSAMAKSAGFVVRTEVPRDTITEAIRRIIAGMNSQQVAYDFEFMDGIISDSLSVRRSTMQLLAALLAILLATIGVYAVVSHLVGRRAHEIGIRMALGAGRRRVVLMVLAQAGKMVGLGHSSPHTTLAFYTQSEEDSQRATISRLERILFPNVPKFEEGPSLIN